MALRASSKRLMMRFQGRPDVGRAQAIAALGEGLPRAEELADLLEVELRVPLGLFRRTDRLDVLLAPFPIGDPLTWLWAESALEDGISEINYRLKRRHGSMSRYPETVRELFEVWCGKPAA